ncbi:MAG TPA: FG-GAP-like repeat-containing protein, partial [Vicinamibacterales bacterium]|nr:FG-GAP-like repeat-containing protein [Vicinamibacterales bacterium]
MLTSWKEIAAFFGRDISTVQRWERERGLPVHRHTHRLRSSVYAYPEALAAWRDRQGAAIANGDDRAAPRPVRWRFAAVSPAARASALIAGLGVLGGGLFWLVRPAAHGAPPVVEVASLPGAAPLAVDSIDDLNGDGRGDLVVHSTDGPEFAIYFAGTHPEPRLQPDVRITASGVASVQGGSVGDVDGDGIADLVISTFFGEPETYTATAPSYLVRGRRAWPSELHLPRDADARFVGRFENGDIRMSVCVTPGGVDLNGDGLRDIILGGPNFSPPGMPSAGGVFVLFGRRAWPERVDVVADADVAIHGSRKGEALTPACATGDFTSGGQPDLALVASEDTLWYMQGGRGRVYLFAGRPDWPPLIQAGDGAALRLDGVTERAHVAPPLLADVNGDGAADLVAGFSHEPGRAAAGRVVIVLGTRDPRAVIP